MITPPQTLLDCYPSASPPVSGEVRRPLRVLQLAAGHALYGAERWVLTLVKHLDPVRVRTTVACLRDADSASLPLLDEARRAGLETLAIDARRKPIVSAVRELRAALLAHPIDIVHTHGVREDLVALMASHGMPVKLLSTPHGWETKCSFKERARTLLNKAVFLGFDAVAPLSEELRAAMRTVPLSRARIHLIRNAVDLSEVDNAEPVEGPLPGQFAAGDFVIGYIGRLIPGKGVRVLLEALGHLPPTGWVCLVIGEGPERERLTRQAERLRLGARVVFLGYHPDRLDYLKRFNLFVLPSFREGTPRCLMEALAAGVPCAGSRIPGICALLCDGITGDTFGPGDARKLAEIIAHQQRDRADALRKAAAGRELVRKAFSATTMARGYEQLYLTLAQP
jgi:glycosyltransferase involved in cell wall biosynthesis